MSHPERVVTGGLGPPLDVEALEALPVDAGGLIQFDFAFRSIRFVARYQEHPAEGGSGGRLKLAGDVGPVPFTAEAPAARAGLAQIVLDAADLLGPSFRFIDGRIVLANQFDIEHPVTASKLISVAARFLVPAIPYLDLIAVYLRPPLAPHQPGEAALRPEWRRKAAARR